VKPTQTALVSDFSRASKWDLERKLDPREQVANDDVASRIEKAPVWVFVADSRRIFCHRGVEIEISEEDSAVQISCEGLHVFASGSSYNEAMESLHEQVVHFYDEYTRLAEDEVIGRAVEIRDLYCKYFEVMQ